MKSIVKPKPEALLARQAELNARKPAPALAGATPGRGKGAKVVQGDAVAPDAVKGRMTEAALLAHVLRRLKALGWSSYHTHDSRRSQPGYPDIAAVRGHRLLYAELKSKTGVLTKDQRLWLDALWSAGAECYVFRPADLDWIDEVLTDDARYGYGPPRG